MQMTLRTLAPVVLLLVAACTGFPFFRDQSSSARADAVSKPQGSLAACGQRQPQPKIEFQGIHYDGEYLSGRFVVGAAGERLRLDKRMFSNIDVNVNSVVDCQTRQNLPFIIMDAFPSRGREEDLLILEPGYWYGASIRFPLFARELGGLGPECIEAELSLMSFEGECVGLHRVQAVRESQVAGDGGVAGGASPSGDAGVRDAGPAQNVLEMSP